MLRQAVELQNSGHYTCIYSIVDYHAMTGLLPAKERAAQTLDLAIDMLAAGIDPKKSILFVQSHVPEHTNLAWILGTITSMGDLQRMTAYKEKVAEGKTPNVGLFTYPVLMAADILLYKAEAVPVGDDQRQHIELAREIVRKFNSAFGKTFKEPRTITAKAERIMSLDNPEKKMSKSIPSGCLFLHDSADEMRKKVMSATTDSFSGIGYDPEKRPGISNLVLIYSEFTGLTPQEVVKKYADIGYADFKRELAEVIINALAPLQKERRALLKKKSEILRALQAGAKKAQKIATQTMEEVRAKVGLV